MSVAGSTTKRTVNRGDDGMADLKLKKNVSPAKPTKKESTKEQVQIEEKELDIEISIANMEEIHEFVHFKETLERFIGIYKQLGVTEEKSKEALQSLREMVSKAAK